MLRAGDRHAGERWLLLQAFLGTSKRRGILTAASLSIFKIFASPQCLGTHVLDEERYSIDVVAIDQQQIDLLECLVRIDRGEALDSRAAGLRDRLIEAGLVDERNGVLGLTPAGIERCRSLQHRIAADREAARVLADRGIALAMEHGETS